MTTPSSCKSFFKQYLFYKLRTQSVTLAASALLNLITLPLLATDILTSYSENINNISRSYNILAPDIIYYFGVIVLFSLAITGGARAFCSCVKKDSVDTLAALPLTRREHFFADMLSGYIANVGAFFPCAVIAMILSVPANKSVDNMCIEKGFPPVDGLIVKWFFSLVLALFLLYTLSYIISVFVTVCCGKISSSIIFTAVISTLMMIAGAGIGSYAEQCVTGLMSSKEDYLNYVPPFGLLRFAYDNYCFMYSVDLSLNQEYPAPSVLGIVLLIVAGAAVTYAAYRVFKNRQAERTGKVMTSNAIYRTLCALSVIAVTSVSLSAAYIFHIMWLPVLISLAITAVMVLVLEAFRGLKKEGFVITGIRCLITMAVCVIALVIVDKSGAFGARYINESPADIESIEIRSTSGDNYYISSPQDYFVQSSIMDLEFDDQKDIKNFLEQHNKTLKRRGKQLTSGFDFHVYVKLKNGETIGRYYQPNRRLIGSGSVVEGIDELNDNLRSLPSYNAKASAVFVETLMSKNEVKAEIKDAFGDVTIPRERLSELLDIFSREFKEKHTPSDTTAGIFIYNPDNYKALNGIDIPSSCTETLDFINSLRGDNSERTALNIMIHINGVYIDCPVTVKEIESELGRELMSLLSDEYEQYHPHHSNPIDIYSSDLNRYYVPKDNFNRVFEIVMRFIEKEYSLNAR